MPIFLSLPYFFYIKSLVLVIQHKKQRWMEPYPSKTSESGMDLPNVLFVFFLFQISIGTLVALVVNSHSQTWTYSYFILTKSEKNKQTNIYLIVLRTSSGHISGFHWNLSHHP